MMDLGYHDRGERAKGSHLHVDQGHVRGVHGLQGKAGAAAVKVGILHSAHQFMPAGACTLLIVIVCVLIGIVFD